MNEVPVHGTVDARFDRVRDLFAQCMTEAELGAAVCAFVDGKKVIDLWGGWAEPDRVRPWEQDTLACIFSAAKAMTATCAHVLVDRGLLELDEPLATYWPEFAQRGKEAITMRMVLSHQAGLPMTTAKLPRGKRFAWEEVTAALARQAPDPAPGTRHEYHGGTFGYLVGAVVERIDGRSLSRFFQEEVASPLGADVLMSFGPEEDDRSAEMVGSKSMVGPCGSRAWRSAGDGAATAFATAEGMARVFAMLAGNGELEGVRLLRKETIDVAVEEQRLVSGPGTTAEFGLGFQLFWILFPGMNEWTFGHMGMGGAIGLADRKRGLAVGFVGNRLHGGSAGPLINTIYEILVA